jgi:hypothetical protein
MASHSTQNNNTCFVCFTEFDQNEIKAESLVCGHQYCKNCWSFYLIDKVKTDGPESVFTKCIQLGCNIVVPHSFFMQHLNDNEEPDEKYLQKYLNWHCR